MARIETDPNYTSPTFSRATAAADAFKKEDVQLLASAVSTHDHGGVHGLPIVAGAIPSGVITSTMIADGTIATGDIAANAITQIGSAVGSTVTPTTTSTTFVDMPEMSVTLTTTGGRLLAWLTSTVAPQVGTTNPIVIALSLDAAAEVGLQSSSTSAVNLQDSMTVVWDFGVVSAASHTIKGRWNTAAGTGGLVGIRRNLLVMEVKK